jgi:hypothetical protein
MTERTNTAIETAEAINSLIEREMVAVEPDDPIDEQPGLKRAQSIIATFIAAARLHQPPKRGRRPEQHPRGFPPGSPPKN